MVNVMDGVYKSWEASLTIAGSQDGTGAEFTISVKNHFSGTKRSGKHTPYNAYVGREITGKINRAMIDGTMFNYLITNNPVGGASGTIVNAGASLNTAGHLAINSANGQNSILQLTTAGATTTTQTQITFSGTDVNGNIIYDYIIIPAGTTIGTVFTTHVPFNTIPEIDVSAAAGASVTCTVVSLAGGQTYVQAAPAAINLQGKVQHAAGSQFYMACNNIYLEGADFEVKGQSILINNVTFVMKDGDADFSCYANPS